eukprot:gene8550-biopygen21160
MESQGRVTGRSEHDVLAQLITLPPPIPIPAGPARQSPHRTTSAPSAGERPQRLAAAQGEGGELDDGEHRNAPHKQCEQCGQHTN